MIESQPHELTPEELALLAAPPAPAGPSQTVPLRVPPGTETSIDELDPRASSGRPGAAVPVQQPPLQP